VAREAIFRNSLLLLYTYKAEKGVCSMKNAILTFGRFNPPTIGHMLLVKKVREFSRQRKAETFIFTGASQDKKRNPLQYKDKTQLMRKAFKGVSVVTDTKIKTIFHALEYLNKKGYEEITLVVGSDRVMEFKNLISKYLKDYNFKSFNVISAGDRDPDEEGAKGMSASKMRDAAKRGDFNAFKMGAPLTLRDADVTNMFKLVQKGMGIKNHMKESWFNYDEFKEFIAEVRNLEERAVSIQARRKMARVAKRTAKKRAKTRKRREKFRKKPEQLKAKAEKAAKMLLRKKLIGKSANWNKLSLTAKAQVDRRVEKKAKAIKKIARKLLPKIKTAEKERIQKLKGKTPGQPSSVKEGGEWRKTYKGAAVAKAKAQTKRETEGIKSKMADVKVKLKKAKETSGAGETVKSLEKQRESARKKRQEAEAKIKASRSRVDALRKQLRKEEHGAGDQGTEALLKKYADETPGQKYAKINNRFKKRFASK